MSNLRFMCCVDGPQKGGPQKGHFAGKILSYDFELLRCDAGILTL